MHDAGHHHTTIASMNACSQSTELRSNRSGNMFDVRRDTDRELTAEEIVEENAVLKLKLLNKSRDYECMSKKFVKTQGRNARLVQKNTQLEKRLASLILAENKGFSVDVSKPQIKSKFISLDGSRECSQELSFKNTKPNIDKELSKSSRLNFVAAFKKECLSNSKDHFKRKGVSLSKNTETNHEYHFNNTHGEEQSDNKINEFKVFIESEKERISSSSYKLSNRRLSWNFSNRGLSKKKGIQKLMSQYNSKETSEDKMKLKENASTFTSKDPTSKTLSNLMSFKSSFRSSNPQNIFGLHYVKYR